MVTSKEEHDVDRWCDTHDEPRMTRSQFEETERREQEKRRTQELGELRAPLRTKNIEWIRVDRGYGTGIRVTFIKRGQRKPNVYYPCTRSVQRLLDGSGETVAHIEDRSIFLELYPLQGEE